MKFSFDEEQREFAATLRHALADRAPVSRWLGPDAWAAEDPAWSLLVTDLEAVASDVPGEFGGLGLSVVELAIIAEELGRVVAGARRSSARTAPRSPGALRRSNETSSASASSAR